MNGEISESPSASDFCVRHGYLTIDGTIVHWGEVGEVSHATPIVLIHGLQDSHMTWREVATNLAKDRRVLMLDLPGHGLSGRPDASYELPWYARVISSWFDAVGLVEADVVGHSLGGGVAQMLLLERPRRIRRLVLAAPGGLGREISFWLRLASIPVVVERFGQPFLGVGTRLARGSALPPGDLSELCKMNGRQGSARAFARTVRDLIDWRGQRRLFFQRAHEVEDLPPISVIWGDQDMVVPAKHAKSLLEVADGIEVTLMRGCGHFLHNEQPVQFTTALRSFFDAPVVRAARLRSGLGTSKRGAWRNSTPSTVFASASKS